MKLDFEPFYKLYNNDVSIPTQYKANDSIIDTIDISENEIKATLIGTRIYKVNIAYNEHKVSSAVCTCPYDYGGYCKHIAQTVVYADQTVANLYNEHTRHEEDISEDFITKQGNSFLIHVPAILALSKKALQALKPEEDKREKQYWEEALSIQDAQIEPDHLEAIVSISGYSFETFKINVKKNNDHFVASCNCRNYRNKLCKHLYLFLKQLQANTVLKLAFDQEARKYVLDKKAEEKGWHNIKDLDSFFKITSSRERLYIEPRINVLSLNTRDKELLKESLLIPFELPINTHIDRVEFIVITERLYTDVFDISLMTAPIAKVRGFKSPVSEVPLYGRIKAAKNGQEFLFYIALGAIQSNEPNVDYYRDILQNPLKLDTYFYKEDQSKGGVIPTKMKPIELHSSRPVLEIDVKESGDFYLLKCKLKLDNKTIKTNTVRHAHGLMLYKDALYTLNNEAEIKVLDFFLKNAGEVYLQQAQFAVFKEEFLDQIENNIKVTYSFIKPASQKVIKERGLDDLSRPIIYLSDQESFIRITPVITYGDIEVPVLSKRTAYTTADDGKLYAIQRDEATEQQLIRNVQAQHLAFDKIPMTDFFYLHKKQFLDDGWFIEAFDKWQTAGYVIHGFNKIKDNRYNQNKISVKTSVQSGIDWFDIHAKVSFGDQQVGLKQLQKSVVNKSRYIELSDGTQGILPVEWLDKFSNYFRAGDIKDDYIRTHKSNFQLIDELFEQEILSQEVQDELKHYKEKLASFKAITAVSIPKKLNAILRDYQKEGLNWLNFLDGFGFGGCLADDMGLGKTIQIIAYILAQHEKGNTGTNLIILPTSLLFNWQAELDKFAPNLKYHVLYGTNRNTKQLEFEQQDIILTTYGTLLSDVDLLKKQSFNLIVLDESQAIKNPDSKRYKAVRLLQGRQRIVLTGTPVENNTFDLYAQLSFALPGLLGSAKRFATDYSTPIDRFQDVGRAKELQRKIHPFVLRRTKKQVAKELPEKTEMILHCEMGIEQKRVYDSYKAEFQKYLAGLPTDELHSSSLHVLQGLTKLRQICNSPALLGDDEYYGSQSAKLEELMSQIMGLKDEHKILVFSQFVGMLDLIKVRLEQENIGYAYLTGQTKNRQEQVDLFQEDENIRVFLISLKAGGTGLNLTEAEYVFLVDPWWNPAVENQAIDRAYRIGQQNKVVAVRLVTPDSIEEKIMELQQRKRQLADELIHVDTNMLKQLSKDDLIGLL